MADFDEASPDISGGDAYNLERLHENATPEQQFALEALYAAFLRARERAEEAERQREVAEREALTDIKTGIPSARALSVKLDELDGRIAAGQYPDAAERRAVQDPVNFGLAFIDLDEFKLKINGIFGHRSGDAFLRHVAQFMSSALRSEDSIYRWGGDEFVVVLEGVPLGSEEDARARLREIFAHAVNEDLDEKLVAQCSQASGVPSQDVIRILNSLRASIGIAIYNADYHKTAQVMLHEADVLMRQDKAENGRGR